MSALFAIFIAGLAVATATTLLTALVLIVAGIHATERHKSLSHRPRSYTEVIARRVLGVHTARPAHQVSSRSKEVSR
jgi:hypothetical protein